jgi:hypothetical protein
VTSGTVGRTNHVTNKCWWKCKENRNAGFGGANFAPQNTKLGKKCVLRTGIISREKNAFRLGDSGGRGEKSLVFQRDHLSLFVEICRTGSDHRRDRVGADPAGRKNSTYQYSTRRIGSNWRTIDNS